MNIDCYFNRIFWNLINKKYSVFKTLYKTSNGDWTENESEANYEKWNGLPNGALCCDIKHVRYYDVKGKIFQEGQEEQAKEEAMKYLIRGML